MSFVSLAPRNPLYAQQFTGNYNLNRLPQSHALFTPPVADAPSDQIHFSAEAQMAGLRSGPQNLMLFGGDRKKAIETLIASGAKAENPKLGFVQNVLRKFAGGKTKTVTKPISAEQSITSKVKVKNFQLKGLRLTTRATGENGVEKLRHIDFGTQTPTGRKGQVKDVGQIIGKTQPRRMFEQEVSKPHQGEPGRIKNSYFDPKTGKKFMQTNEVSPVVDKDSFQAYRTKKTKNTYREINMLNGEGKVNQRYVFDYGGKSIRMESLGTDGQVTGTKNMSRKTDYWKLVDSLSLNPPSLQAAAASPPAAAPAPASKVPALV